MSRSSGAPWLGALLVCLAANCSDEPELFPGDFERVSLEEGGFCGPAAREPCWVRTVVFRTGKLAIERFSSSKDAQLGTADLDELVRFVNREDFRAALTSTKRQCPTVFDADVILEFKTDRAEKRDVFVGGCIAGEDEAMRHPYKGLWDILRRFRLSTFPDSEQ
jgi:hypothetical protein